MRARWFVTELVTFGGELMGWADGSARTGLFLREILTGGGELLETVTVSATGILAGVVQERLVVSVISLVESGQTLGGVGSN